MIDLPLKGTFLKRKNITLIQNKINRFFFKIIALSTHIKLILYDKQHCYSKIPRMFANALTSKEISFFGERLLILGSICKADSLFFIMHHPNHFYVASLIYFSSSASDKRHSDTNGNPATGHGPGFYRWTFESFVLSGPPSNYSIRHCHLGQRKRLFSSNWRFHCTVQRNLCFLWVYS